MTSIRRSILILSVVFIAVYSWFNFEYLSFRFGMLLGTAEHMLPIETEEVLMGKTFSYPIASEKKVTLVSAVPGANTANAATIPSTKPAPSPIQDMTAPLSSYSLSIPALNVNAPVILEPTTNQNRIYKSLAGGVIHYATSPLPGEPGTSLILGHSSSPPWQKGKYDTVFSNLSKLKSGDVIEIKKNEQVYRFSVTKVLIFTPSTATDLELAELEQTTGTSIILMTCWPTGSNSKRIAVRADLMI